MPSAPRRSSSLINEEFLTSDNTDDGREIENKITENEDKPQVNENELNENDEKSQDQENKEDEEEIEEGFEVLDPAEEPAFKKQMEQEQELCKQFSALKLDDLKARLHCKNFKTGPMDARNRKVYEAKLAKLEVRPSKENGDRVSIRSKWNEVILLFYFLIDYCPVLQKFILNVERENSGDNQKIGQAEELLLRNHFTQSTPKQEVVIFSYF